MAVINASYDEIQSWLDNSTIQEHCALNDTINVSYGTYTMPFQITGFEPKTFLVDGKEEDRPALNLLFHYTDVGSTIYGSSDSIKYSASTLRSSIITTIQNKLDPEFVKHIGLSKVRTYSRDGQTDVVYDQLFAPSMAELGVTNPAHNTSQQAAIEGPAFEYYQGAADAKRVKQAIDATGLAQYYWTRSIYSGASYAFGLVSPSGEPAYDIYVNPYQAVAACNFMANPKKEKLNDVLISRDGETVSPTKVMVSTDGKATKVTKCYAGIDGVAKLVFPGEQEWSPNYIVLQSTYSYTTSTTDITIENKWDAPIIVTRSDTGESHTLEGRSVTGSSNLSQVVLKNFRVLQEISIQEGEKDAFRKWDFQDNYNPLVRGPQLFKCTMPDMNVFTEDEEGTVLPSGAFYQFNCEGAIQRFNDGAFLTDNITTMDGPAHFAYFNYQGAMIEHPKKAFCFPKVTSVGSRFMQGFNYKGNMYYIANDAFDTRSITSVGNYYLQWFNGMTAGGIHPPGGPTTTYIYFDGALGQSSNGSPVFVNNSSSSIAVVYRGNSRGWTTIPKGGKMNFNNDPNSESEREPS